MDSKARYWGAFFFSPIFLISGLASATSVMGSCPATALTADVVAIDHPMVFNRLGAQNVNWMMYALRHDLIELKSKRVLDYSPDGERRFRTAARKHTSRDIALRPDLRPRPLVLRVAEGGYLKVRFTNLLHTKPVPPRSPDDPFPNQANPFDSYPDPLPGIDHPVEHAAKDANGTLPRDKIFRLDDQVASRTVGFHPQGLQLVGDINDDSSYVGKNANSLAKPHDNVPPGETREYCFYAPKEGAFMVSSDGAVFGGEGTSGDSGVGLFGAVTVQPKKARFYRAQLTEEEMRLAVRGKTPTGQPIIDYEATYPNDCPDNGIWCQEGKAGLPILNMVQAKRIIHGDINAIIAGPGDDGSFPYDTYPLENNGKRNPALPNRLEPFREFVSIFHDENAATQAFPYFFEHPELKHTLHGVRDAFMINYGSGGIGAEIIANRLKAGPMQDCLDCAYEEFFLSSFAVGDPATLVDKPANLTLSQCQPEYIRMVNDGENEILDPVYTTQRDKFCTQPKYKLNDPRDQRAAKAYYPHDPANVHHSYIGDFVKFRNMHSGKEQHIFHLHNHQWLFNANDDNSNYLDAQGIGPGSGYTYEIAYGGSGNRNKTVGDAIFHCHFYPHFAQGMWYLWRNHDVFEAGTRLKVSDEGKNGIHQSLFGLMDGTPATGSRALPDGEIVAGTPIPAIVPLPGKGMPLMPAKVSVRPRISLDGNVYGSVAEVVGPAKEGNKNPGYPFWVAGVAGKPGEPVSVGSRPTTPPLDMFDPEKTFIGPVLSGLGITPLPATVSGHDGGLPRHGLAGYSEHGKTKEKFERLTAEKHIEKAKPVYYPEQGTPLEEIAMVFHASREHETHRISMGGAVSPAKFVTNGAPPVPGAPYNEPCIDDATDEVNNKANLLITGGDGKFFGGTHGSYIRATTSLPGGIEFGGDKPRIYKGANLQLDVVFNKLGYHYPQQRILTLWEDVGPLLSKERAPEPLVIRMNTFDCAMYAHTNLVPKDFYADDYQITTPTDAIGQHIHLPKWDLTSADGSANGWNYEDGTFSPGMVRERITAINRWNIDHNPGAAALVPTVHPYFNSNNLPQHQKGFCEKKWHELGGDADKFDKEWGHPGKCDWFGARTTLQRWFSDPVINTEGVHRGLGITFTHDHLGPSTHQQLGLYATMLTEPPGSLWRHNETGETLYNPARREDGGPTSWQAVITGKKGQPIDIDDDKRDDSHREFFLQFGDFQHAYQKDAFYGVTEEGIPWHHPGGSAAEPDTESFRQAINPSVRKPAASITDILKFEPDCPGGTEPLPGGVYSSTSRPPRPCPEAISADDIGMMVVNYRNEPIGARVYDPGKLAGDGRSGAQAASFAGDLAFALQTRTDRAIPSLNTRLGDTPYPSLTSGILLGDPFTPILRAYSGDLIRIKIQAGSHEHEHNASINALLWTQGGSGFGQAPHSGWRNAQNAGLSEQFTMAARITDYETPNLNDRMYTIDSSQDGMWNGVWGVLRSKNRRGDDDNLVPLPTNPLPTVLSPHQGLGKYNDCPVNSLVRRYEVAAVLANHALENRLGVTIPPATPDSRLDPRGGTLVYNPRATTISIQIWDEKVEGYRTETYGSGPLHDPTAILFVRNEDLDNDGKIKAGLPVEPLVLRAAAGECIQVILHNRLPKARSHMADLDGYTALSGVVTRSFGTPGSGSTSFNNNLIRPSNRIGLHPQMVHYDVQAYDGNNVGVNKISTIRPGWSKIYQWYAGVMLPPPFSAEVCPNEVGDIEDIDSIFRELSVFAKEPKLRPLTELITESGFKDLALSMLDREYVKSGIATESALRTARGLVDLVKAEKLSDRSGLEQGCFELISSEEGRNRIAPRHENISVAQRSILTTGQLFREGSDAKLKHFNDQFGKQGDLEQAPLLGTAAFYDRGNVLQKRLSCVKQLARRFSEVVPQNVAETLSRSFAYEVEGIEPSHFEVGGERATKPAYAWRLDSYPSWNRGTTRLAALSNKCRFVDVEFGGTNLSPPDRIKQGQKAAIGALIVEPKGASWREVSDDNAIDRQNPGPTQANVRKTRTTAIVDYPINNNLRKNGFRDLVMIHQKGLNLRYKDGSAVRDLAPEKEKAGEAFAQTAPEDPHDSGHMAINYGTEPMWFRFGLPPDAPFGKEGFGGAASAWQVFSNACCDNRTPVTGGTVISADPNVGEPYVPIMTVRADQEMRIRTLLPTGAGRASTVELHGHQWQRDPYLAERSVGGYPIGGRPAEWGTPSVCIGSNALGMNLGGQESVTPMAHFDMVFPRAGGKHNVAGDYLWRDHAGFGITHGLWAIVRVERPWWHWLSGLYPHPLRDNCK